MYAELEHLSVTSRGFELALMSMAMCCAANRSACQTWSVLTSRAAHPHSLMLEINSSLSGGEYQDLNLPSRRDNETFLVRSRWLT